MCNSILASAMLLWLVAAGAAQQTATQQVPIKRVSWAYGQQMYRQYCAACHGENAAGGGPAAAACTVKPTDLTKLAARHGGKFPYDYFYAVMQFGSMMAAPPHGLADMPVWLPLFSPVDSDRAAIAQQRMRNLAGYVATLQVK